MITSARETSYEQQTKKVVIELALTKTSAPLCYIAFHTGIKEPLPPIKLEENDGFADVRPQVSSALEVLYSKYSLRYEKSYEYISSQPFLSHMTNHPRL